MKRRSSSRFARAARPASQRRRSSTGRRSFGPLLRLALPVLATALTLGSFLINVMAGGFATAQGVTAWVLTGVSALVCAFAWWTYVTASAAEKEKQRAAEPAFPTAEEDLANGHGDGYGSGNCADPAAPAYGDDAAHDSSSTGSGDYGEATAAWTPPPSGAAVDATAAFPPADTGPLPPGNTGASSPSPSPPPPPHDSERTTVGTRWDVPPPENNTSPLPTGPTPSHGPASPPPPVSGSEDTGGFPTIPAPPYSVPHSDGPDRMSPRPGADDPLSGPAPSPGAWRPSSNAVPRGDRAPWESGRPAGDVRPARDILGGPASGPGTPPEHLLGEPWPAPGGGTGPRYTPGMGHYPNDQGGDLFSDQQRKTTGPNRREDDPWPYPPPQR